MLLGAWAAVRASTCECPSGRLACSLTRDATAGAAREVRVDSNWGVWLAVVLKDKSEKRKGKLGAGQGAVDLGGMTPAPVL